MAVCQTYNYFVFENDKLSLLHTLNDKLDLLQNSIDTDKREAEDREGSVKILDQNVA